jgi:hypothetical protein
MRNAPPEPLALLHRFETSQRSAENVGFFATQRMRDSNGHPRSYIVSLDDIVQPAPLVPRFGLLAADLQVSNDDCIDGCDKFYINCFHSAHTYQTIW